METAEDGARTLKGNTYESIIWDSVEGRFKFFLILAHDDEHRLQHVEIHAAKMGSFVHNLMTSMERTINVAIDNGSLAAVIHDLYDQDFRPKGRTNDHEIPVVLSIPNFIAQRIVLDGYLTEPADGMVL